MKKIIIISIGLLISMTTLAQYKEKLKANMYADFVSSYIWRGQELSKASIQPGLLLTYSGLELELWGSYETAGAAKYKEIDITLLYKFKGFTIGLQDVWSDNGQNPDNRYFMYKAHKTYHNFEAKLGYNFGPLYLEWNTVFAGRDGVNGSGKRAYTSYFEADIPFRLGGCYWRGTLGVVPYATTTHKTNGFAVTNVALRVSKGIKITNTFTIPIYVELAANPRLQKTHMCFGFTLEP